ncbi:restriction endonuclease subunit S [Streptomyces sp. NPDC005790]|uniref:restriction endonuclease subunit S n=1 Tax=Streptomyces sp. NPDC005790 TaxID=3154777 RepID=UPI0033DB3CAF
MTQGDFSDKYTKITSADPDRVKDLWLEPGDILIQRSNTPDLVGTAALFEGSKGWAIYPDLLIRVRVQPLVLPKFVAHMLNSGRARAYFKTHAKGLAGSMPKIDQAVIAGFSIPLPPLAEQHRIVEALEAQLSRLDAAVALTEQVVARAGHLRTSVTDITLGCRAADGAEKASPPSCADSEDGDLPDLQEDWAWRRLGELAEVVGGVTKDSKKQSDPTNPEVPYLRVANVQRGKLDLDTITRIRVPRKKAEQLRLLPGDVLLNEGGDRNKLGRGWVWEGQIEDAIHQNHVFRARIHDDRLHPKLLSWHANRSGKWFEINGKQSVNLASISLSKIRQFPVPVPPGDVQAQIVDRIETQSSLVDNAELLARQALKRSASLRQALLNRAFTGALVPQDPTDTPAAELLAQIQAERAAQPKPQRARRAKKAAAPAPAPEPTDAPATAVQQEFEL